MCPTMSREDMRVINILQKTTRMCGDYETGLLWRDEEPKLLNNRWQAQRRLESLKRKFSCDSGLEGKYRAAMDECNAKRYARYLFLEEDATRGPRTHFAVVNANKPDNFDAAAELERTSLNNNLLQRPDYTISLVGVSSRIRQDNTAVVADIKSMFHQVKVREEDQDSLRFCGGKRARVILQKSM